jgi:two-component system chemotaxis sensor kinase CheA
MDRLSERTRQRLAVAATNAFLEYLGARGGTSRNRLRGVWATLRDDLSSMQSVPLAAILERHAARADGIARELGKEVAVEVDAGTARVEARVAEALDLAAVHLIRNAIDHGIEQPAVRTAAGKPARGTIRIRVHEKLGMTTVEIEDDGGGIDLEAVRARAVERELLRPERAASAGEQELLDCVFHPGFTTRSTVTELSGRGVGMDAVKSAVVRVGGSVRIATTRGRGSTVILETPAAIRQLRAYQFLSPGGAISLAFSARWTPDVEPGPSPDALDPTAAIHLAGSSRQTVVDLAKPIRDLVLRLRWGFLEIAVRAATEPVLITADRICPTPDDFPIEVVSVEQQETILLRPEHLANLVERRSPGSS